jgi:hypothetical protein
MDVQNFPESRQVPLILCAKDTTIVVHDLTLSTKFKLHINFILLEK